MRTEVADLVRRAQAGEQDAITELCRYHRPRVLAFLRAQTTDRELAEDLTQETLLRMLRRLGSFDPARGAQFVSWLFSIARNLCIDHWRKQQKLTEVAVGVGADLDIWMVADRSTETAVLQQLECNQLLAGLPPTLVGAVLLTQGYRYSIAETAARLGVPEGTIKSRTHHGLRQLAQLGADR